jgi:hypothetical protein
MSGPNVEETVDSLRETLDPVVAPLREFLDPVLALATTVLIAIRSSFVAFVVSIGAGLVVTSVLLSGYVLPSVNYGIISAMTFIWGVSAFVYAVLGKALLRLIGYA